MNLSEIVYPNKLHGYSIMDLLPQNPEAIIVDPKLCADILKLLHHLISLLINSIDRFYVHKDYLYFDPHVGENACQIRAYMFLLLSKRKYLKKAVERIHFLKKKKEELQNLLNSEIVYKNKGKNLTVIELLLKYNLLFYMPLTEVFIYKSYVLTVFRKEENDLFYIDNEYISVHLKISKFLAKKIVYRYQFFLSCMSCDFIKRIAQRIGLGKKDYANLLSSVLYSDGKMIYPCFFYSKILFMHMEKTKCTVLVILDTINHNNRRKDLILFDKGSSQGRLLTPSSNPIKEDRCMVFKCSRITTVPLSSLDLLKKLNHFGLYTILLANMAAHPQFSGSKLIPFANQLVPDTTKLVGAEKKIEEEFLTCASNAYKNGFCREKPSLLWAKHVFMDTISHQINSQQNDNNYISVRETVDI